MTHRQPSRPLSRILVHMVAQTDRHAGQADIVRELVDGVVGWQSPGNNMASGDEAGWASYRDKLENVASSFR